GLQHGLGDLAELVVALAIRSAGFFLALGRVHGLGFDLALVRLLAAEPHLLLAAEVRRGIAGLVAAAAEAPAIAGLVALLGVVVLTFAFAFALALTQALALLVQQVV